MTHSLRPRGSGRPTEDPLPDLILAPADVGRVIQSPIATTRFADDRSREIARLLEMLSIVERTAETKLRAWNHDPESHGEIAAEIATRTHRVRKRFHDVFLQAHAYPEGPQMLLMPSDVYAHRRSSERLPYRSFELQNVAYQIEMIARFHQEFETYATRRGGYEEPERLAMARDTVRRIASHREQLTRILTGDFEKR